MLLKQREDRRTNCLLALIFIHDHEEIFQRQAERRVKGQRQSHRAHVDTTQPPPRNKHEARKMHAIPGLRQLMECTMATNTNIITYNKPHRHHTDSPHTERTTAVTTPDSCTRTAKTTNQKNPGATNWHRLATDGIQNDADHNTSHIHKLTSHCATVRNRFTG